MSSPAPVLDLLRSGTMLGMRLVGLTKAPLALAAPLVRSRAADREPVVLRSAGRSVGLDRASLAGAFPHATGRLLVLVPDGADDESSWSAGVNRTGGTYASRMAHLLDWTPVHLNIDPDTGPAQLAVELSAILQRLVEGWPCDVGRIAFLAHGSGGLVVRSACGVANHAPEPWHELVSDVIALGTPHLAVPAARRLAPTTSRDLEERLAGVTTVDRADPDVPGLDHATYAVVTPRNRVERSLVGGLLGNVLWWRQRTTLRPRRAHALFPTAEVHHVETGEAGLVNHPDVHTALLAWLA